MRGTPVPPQPPASTRPRNLRTSSSAAPCSRLWPRLYTCVQGGRETGRNGTCSKPNSCGAHLYSAEDPRWRREELAREPPLGAQCTDVVPSMAVQHPLTRKSTAAAPACRRTSALCSASARGTMSSCLRKAERKRGMQLGSHVRKRTISHQRCLLDDWRHSITNAQEQ